jgi:hypothetical protein
MVGTKTMKISGGERNIDGAWEGDCRRWGKIAESNVVFFSG